MRWAAVLIALAGCQATLGDPSVAADASAGADAVTNDASLVADSRVISDGPLADARACDDGDVNAQDPANGHCYMLFQTVESWANARMRCAALGANSYLAVITTAEENVIVAPMAGLLDAWMGANDIDNEMVWVWITGEPFVYDNWRAGEPNDVEGEDCMIIEGARGGSWDDRSCAQTYAYLCEREP